MNDKLDFNGFLKLFALAFFTVVAFWPWIRDLWSKEAREIERDMKGDNNKWDMFEIWERHSLRVGRGSWVAIWFMLFWSSFFNFEFPVWLWSFFFTGTLGMAGIAAYMMKLRGKQIEINSKKHDQN